MGLSKIICVKKCDNCGKDVEIRHKERLNRDNIFCSKKCEAEYRKSHNPNYFSCEICGKLVYRKPSNVMNHIFCSNQCTAIFRKNSNYFIGENNPNYNNIRIKDNEIMNKNGYVWIRKMKHPYKTDDGWIREHRVVFEENFQFLLNDKNSIEMDGIRYIKEVYDVHHLDLNKTNNVADNLTMLTRSEHKKLHWFINKNKEIYFNNIEKYKALIKEGLITNTDIFFKILTSGV